jgi:hypothetical protein
MLHSSQQITVIISLLKNKSHPLLVKRGKTRKSKSEPTPGSPENPKILAVPKGRAEQLEQNN